jgi:hypothetical protein
MARKHRKHSRKHALAGFFSPKNKWVWAGVGAAAIVVYVYRKELFGLAAPEKAPKLAGLGYMVPTYDTAATLTAG